MIGVLHHMADVNLVDIFFYWRGGSTIGGGSGGGEGRGGARGRRRAANSVRKTFSFPDKYME